MKTVHKIFFKNASDMKEISDKSIDLMVTSPPYPMIEMWDDVFSKQNSAIGKALKRRDGNKAFELMHKELDEVWAEVYRVLKDGGFACINIGDATRTIGGEFKLYMSHSRILQCCLELGFNPLPEILWRKQTNAPNKFMGSGMLPAGAYVTLEHEFILILRKGSKREFSEAEKKLRRQESAFFWEERNVWFSDVWKDLKGTKQNNIDKTIRDRSGAFPFELPYRLINMFSLKEDTVLDPFLGTGTTTIAAMATGRNSIGFEINPNFKDHIFARFNSIADFSNQQIENRLGNHLAFVQERIKTHGGLGYLSKYYGFPVMTSQETEILFDELSKVEVKNGVVEVEYKERPTLFFKNGELERKDKPLLSNWT
ncbi:MAG TPA: site-specific DNA-methyltransferase [Candidatus Bathyarchaeia archaeon]|nr:site-specific DNA-methyltransferase [Candidatus Bathyarchaeia archaeon]